MERVKIKALWQDAQSFAGQSITVCGWARTIRDMKNFGFLELNDGSSFKGLQVVLARPERFEQATELADYLREKRAVVVNMEAADKDLTRRVVDFLSGCAYALDGRVKKIAVSTFLATPCNVDIVGDIIDELENSGLYL